MAAEDRHEISTPCMFINKLRTYVDQDEAPIPDIYNLSQVSYTYL